MDFGLDFNPTLDLGSWGSSPSFSAPDIPSWGSTGGNFFGGGDQTSWNPAPPPQMSWGQDMSQIQNFLQQDRATPQLSEGFYQGALNKSGGNYGQAAIDLGTMREKQGGAWSMDPALRNAAHAMMTQYSGSMVPGLGGLIGSTVSPAYSAAKYLMQDWTPGAVANPLNSMFMDLFGDRGNLLGASTPSWEEIWWGLRPFWGKN